MQPGAPTLQLSRYRDVRSHKGSPRSTHTNQRAPPLSETPATGNQIIEFRLGRNHSKKAEPLLLLPYDWIPSVYFLRFCLNPASPKIPEPSNQIAPGIGTEDAPISISSSQTDESLVISNTFIVMVEEISLMGT